jgi:hypothetical protein
MAEEIADSLEGLGAVRITRFFAGADVQFGFAMKPYLTCT